MNIRSVEIVDELKQSYLDYAMDVIVDRALPDARDGLKPVHRRILYAMYDLRIFHEHATVKSARVVGEVIGKYHPHGDSAVYETMVRMAQDFSLRYPLIDGQGNFGSIDNDPAAAMRYTEVRLQKISERILDDLNKETVDLKANYDNTLMIPDYVLPTRIPNLLVNGSSGIAVGLATNIPTHNLTEVINGVLAVIDDPQITNNQLMKYIPGPDFPTGGQIFGRDGIISAYNTGKGRVILRSRYHIETSDDGRQTIVIDEIPYGVVKIDLVRQIVNLVNEKKISGISEVCDRSGKDVSTGIRIEIELKQNEYAEVVVNHLFKMTMMQSSFPVNMVAIVKGRPKTLTLRECLDCFIEHRKEVVTRRNAFDLRKARDHAHLVEGQLAAQDNLDEVVRLIRTSQTRDEAKKRLLEREWPIHVEQNAEGETFQTLLERCGADCRPMYVAPELGYHNGVYRLTPEQADNILAMRLSQLVRLAKDELFADYREQAAIVEKCLRVLHSIEELMKEIKGELIEIREAFGDARRTEIVDAAVSIEIEDLITPCEVVVTLSKSGYVKYQPLEDYNAQRRGGTGRKGANLKDDDAVYKLIVANLKDYIMCFTNLGKVYCIKVFQLPEGSFYSRGRPIVNVIPIQEGEFITAILPIKDFSDGKYVVLATRRGFVKKVRISEFSNVMKSGKKAITFKTENDILIGADLTDGDDDIILVTADGRLNRFNQKKNPKPSPFVLEKVALEGEDENIIEDAEVEEAAADSSDADPDDDDQNTTELLRPMGRLAGGVRCFNLLGDDYVVSLIVPKIELGGRLLFATESGYGSIIQIARFPRRNGRNSQGVRSMKLDDRNGNRLVGALQVTLEDEVMLITDQGNIIRTFVDQIRETGRLSKGVRIIRLANDAKLITLERIAREALDDKDEVISSEDAAETEDGTVTDDTAEQEPQNSEQ